MAFGAKKIFPIDRNPRVAVGVKIPFSAPSVFTSTYTTKDAIKTNLVNFFLTNTNERYLNPTFGGNLRGFVFEQIDSVDLDFLKSNIQSQLSSYFPSVQVDRLEILKYADQNQITVMLDYSILDTGITDVLQISFT